MWSTAIYQAVAPTVVLRNAAPSGSQTFKYTGAAQHFKVPTGVTELTVVARGGGTPSGHFPSQSPRCVSDDCAINILRRRAEDDESRRSRRCCRAMLSSLVLRTPRAATWGDVTGMAFS